MKHSDNFFEVWGGISGCQHLLPLLVNSDLRPNQIAQLTSENVATRFRISEKGGIALGKDADLSFIDPKADELITADSLFYRHRQTPYLGRTLRGRVVRTILRGQTIFRNGKLQARPTGKLVRPARS